MRYLDVVFVLMLLAAAPRAGIAQNTPDQTAKVAAARNFIKTSNAVEAMVAAMRANLPHRSTLGCAAG
jgi:hypothetical protein